MNLPDAVILVFRHGLLDGCQVLAIVEQREGRTLKMAETEFGPFDGLEDVILECARLTRKCLADYSG